MRKKEFSCHLRELTPALKKLIYAVKRSGYFGIYDASDLIQETMISLYMKVPKSYDPKKATNHPRGHRWKCKCERCINAAKANLKSYCMESARNCLKRIASRQYRHQAEMNVDWMTIGQDNEGDPSNDSQKDLHVQALKKSQVEPKRKSVIFKIKLGELAKTDKDFHIVNTVYHHDSNRKAACRTLGVSNASITKVFKRVRRHTNIFTITTNPIKDFMDKGVNVFSKTGIK